MPLVVLRDGRALDETSDLVDDGESSPFTTNESKMCILSFFFNAVNVLKPRVAALEASPAHSNHSLGSDFTPDITPISSSTPSEVDPTDQYSLLEPEEIQKERVFRDYANACDRVKNFYTEQHSKQTVEYNIKARHYFHSREKLRMGVWEAIEHLNTLVDDSDPDVSRRPSPGQPHPWRQTDEPHFPDLALAN